ncbi:MAG: SGNH/GDSL hydrolase family protein [Phycisphaerales bacterium]|jgi:hypothetical protein|nr:SGNH/GDSL hydrolase family protein [Phycisphaerales bacterium]
MNIKKLSSLAVCAVIGVAVLGGSLYRTHAAKAPAKKTIRVLFVGNSYTYGNKLPQVVAAMARADKTVAPMEVKMVASGGKNLIWHSQNKTTLDAIAEGWDYVILQDQSLTPTLMPQRTRKGAAVLDAAIKKAGAKTMFFMTWQRKPTPELLKKYPDMHKRNSETYMSVARELKAAVAPVGYAWKAATDANPNCPLYTKDNSHPSRAGTYLAACVFYSTIYNKPPTRLPATVILSQKGNRKTVLSIPSTLASTLKPIAWTAVQKAKKELTSKPKTK